MKETATTRFDLSHVNMIDSVINFCLSPEQISITQSVPAFYNLITNVLQPKLSEINNLNAAASSSIRGYTEQKKSLKVTLAAMSTTIMNSVYAYALNIKDPVLAAKMMVSRSGLMGERYLDFIAIVGGAINNVAPLVNQLADYNVTQAEVNEWQNLLAELTSKLSLPNNMIAQRMVIRMQALQALRHCIIVLYKQCDTIALQFQRTNSMFYNGYKNNRKLKPHRLSTQLRAHITMNGEPVPYAEVYIISTDRSGTTDANGYCLLNELPFGTFEVAVSTKEGTQNFGRFRFKKGHSRTEHFNLPSSPMTKGLRQAQSPERFV